MVLESVQAKEDAISQARVEFQAMSIADLVALRQILREYQETTRPAKLEWTSDEDDLDFLSSVSGQEAERERRNNFFKKDFYLQWKKTNRKVEDERMRINERLNILEPLLRKRCIYGEGSIKVTRRASKIQVRRALGTTYVADALAQGTPIRNKYQIFRAIEGMEGLRDSGGKSIALFFSRHFDKTKTKGPKSLEDWIRYFGGS